MDTIVLRSAERKALLSLKSTTAAQERTQDRLATGLKVNSAIDAPEAFFVAKSLSDTSQDFLERMDDINQTISMITAAQDALDGITTILQQMKGIVTEASTSDNPGADQFDDMLQQLNTLVDDATYQGVNLLGRTSGAGETVTTETQTVEFGALTDSKVDITGQYAGSSYYLSSGSSTLVPDSTGSSLSTTGGSSEDYAITTSYTQINETESTSEQQPKITELDDGGFVVVWNNYSFSGVTSDIVGKIYNSDGSVRTAEFTIRADPANDLIAATGITSLDDGGFIVAWSEPTSKQVYAEKFDANGNSSGVNQISGGGSTYTYPSVTSLTGGGYAISFLDAPNKTVLYEIYDASGTKIRDDTDGALYTGTDITGTTISALSNGDFVVSILDNYEVYTQRVDASGAALGSAELSGPSATNLEVMGLGDDRYIAVWINNDQVLARIFDNDGTDVSGGAFTLISPTSGLKITSVDIDAMADGGFVVSYAEEDNAATTFNLSTIVFDSSGNQTSSLIDSEAEDGYTYLSVTALADGGFITGAMASDAQSDGSFYQRHAGPAATASGEIGSVSSVNYDSGVVTADVGGESTTMTITKQGLGVVNAWYYQDLSTAEGREAATSDLSDALTTVRSLSSRLGGEISLLQVRSDFTENLSSTLKEGADKLTLADVNEEGADLLALSTRASLGMQALSFLGATNTSILGLFN